MTVTISVGNESVSFQYSDMTRAERFEFATILDEMSPEQQLAWAKEVEGMSHIRNGH